MAVGVLHGWELKAFLQYSPVTVDMHALEMNVLDLVVVNEMV